MLIALLGFLVSAVPTLILFPYLRNSHKREEQIIYQKLCDKSFLRGILFSIPIAACTGCTVFLMNLLGIGAGSPIVHEAVYSFIAVAFMEEMGKFLIFRSLIKKTNVPLSWRDLVILMTLVGLGFGIAENLALALEYGLGVMLVRALMLGHGGYGYLMGYFYGKAEKTGKSGYKVFGFLLTWMIHGMYDFSLSDSLLGASEYFVIAPLALAAVSVFLAVRMIVFFIKSKKIQLYSEPLQRTGLTEADVLT